MYLYWSPSTQDWNKYHAIVGFNEEYWMRKVVAAGIPAVSSAGHVVKMGGTVSYAANVREANAWFRALAASHGVTGAAVNNWIRANCIYVASHSNAGGGEGGEIWYYTGNTKGRALADAVAARVFPISDAPDRGVKASTKYGELNGPITTAIIIEYLFHDDASDALEMSLEFEAFGLGTAYGILDYIGTAPLPRPAPTTPPPTAIGSRLLSRYMAGEDVKQMQVRLNIHGASLAVDGKFGDMTYAAVRRFQAAKGLSVDGIIGDNTRAALMKAPAAKAMPLLKLATPYMKGESVKTLQRALRARGYIIAVDGVFGPATKSAVVKWQGRARLAVDGIVGKNTWASLGY